MAPAMNLKYGTIDQVANIWKRKRTIHQQRCQKHHSCQPKKEKEKEEKQKGKTPSGKSKTLYLLLTEVQHVVQHVVQPEH